MVVVVSHYISWIVVWRGGVHVVFSLYVLAGTRQTTQSWRNMSV